MLTDKEIFLYYPDYKKDWKFVLQAHPRSRSVHCDLRIEIIKNKQLVGFTVAALKSIPKEPKNLSEAKAMINKKLPELKKNLHDPNIKYIAIKKKPQPYGWLEVDDASFGPGSIGATSERQGFMLIIDSGLIEFGSLKPKFSEYWFKGKKDLFTGRFVVRNLPNIWKKQSIDEGSEIKTGKGLSVNMSTFVDPLDPYVLSSRAVRKKWIPPNGVPALPKFIRDQIPKEYHYWNQTGEKARSVRDALVEYNKKEKIVYKVTENKEIFMENNILKIPSKSSWLLGAAFSNLKSKIIEGLVNNREDTPSSLSNLFRF